ncbi:pentapeptide repeat-containing protein [Spirillospora sp. NPDC127200]
MNDDDEANRQVRRVNVHRVLGLWSIRRALTSAFVTAVILLIAAWFFISWLLGSPPKASPKPLDTTAQLELLKLVFALVAGVGALVALVTAYRRQRVDEAAAERAERAQAHTEQVARDNAYDASQRRVTELYGQAVEQLGHDKAAVRLGGLYSLERLGQDHPQHRQTIVDVVCSYLRMPFQSPRLASSNTQSSSRENNFTGDIRQEIQVRLAAQRLLARRLSLPVDQDAVATDAHWSGIRVDLAGAQLIDFDFSLCRTTEAIFSNVDFSGNARFDGARFDGRVKFDEAKFDGPASFSESRFIGDACFDGVNFDGDSWFHGARFDRYANFEKTQFGGAARCNRAKFKLTARFDRSHFKGDAWFDWVQFGDGASFERAQLRGDARFNGAHFKGSSNFGRSARFSESNFYGDAYFDSAHFEGDAGFAGAHFGGLAGFVRAKFKEGAGFVGTRFDGTALFTDSQFDQEPNFVNASVRHSTRMHVWPRPWHVHTATNEAAKLVRQGADA